MNSLNNIQENQSIKIITKQKEQEFKGGGLGNFKRKEGKNCPPPFEPDWKGSNR